MNETWAIKEFIQDRGQNWSEWVRAIKFDVEFKAIEEERRRIAKELHDDTLPTLARLTRNLQKVELKEKTKEIVPHLLEVNEAFRNLLAELHPVDLEELGLVDAIRNLSRRYSTQTSRSIEFNEYSDSYKISEFQQLCVYRALQLIYKMFLKSKNDMLVVSYSTSSGIISISIRCLDKRVSRKNWLFDNHHFDNFEVWCNLAGAQIKTTNDGDKNYDCDLVIAIPETIKNDHNFEESLGKLTLTRLEELDKILLSIKKEWKNAFDRDCALFKQIAVEVERKKIKSEINHLVSAKLNHILRLARSSNSKQVNSMVTRYMNGVNSSINDVIANLTPHILDEVGLLASIRTLVDRFRHATLIDTIMIYNLWFDWNNIVSIDTKFEIYRIIQEALNNVEKHSKANKTKVVVSRFSNNLIFKIEDNGLGFEKGLSQISRGLQNIKERSKAIGATVKWSEAESFDRGTLVTIEIPCLEVFQSKVPIYEISNTVQLG